MPFFHRRINWSDAFLNAPFDHIRYESATAMFDTSWEGLKLDQCGCVSVESAWSDELKQDIVVGLRRIRIATMPFAACRVASGKTDSTKERRSVHMLLCLLR
jgi:hypothetical protein